MAQLVEQFIRNE